MIHVPLLAWMRDAPTALGGPFLWGLLLAALGIWLLMPEASHRRRMAGCALGLLGLLLIAAGMPQLAHWPTTAVFWTLATLTVVSAAAMIAMQSPVYSAIWFALSLLGTAGLFLLQGAQFLGIATIIVYAGAIVVTFLFVIMLAQPRGREIYDRLTWGWFPKPFAAFSAVAIVALVAISLAGVRAAIEAAQPIPAGIAVGEDWPAEREALLAPRHVASLGAELFVRHLVAVEVAGVLLLVALVGAIAIAIHGREPPPGRRESPPQ